MVTTCAECGCLVERGVRVAACADDACCCSHLSTREALDHLARAVRTALSEGDLEGFGSLLAPDVRWGDDDAPNRCRSRDDVVSTLRGALERGVNGSLGEVETGPAGVLAHLVVTRSDAPEKSRDLYHLYAVRAGRISEIVPYSSRADAAAALAAIPT
ncbi:MAG: nuclear transport factor 2 family protein [Acidimicrobiales bacterium]